MDLIKSDSNLPPSTVKPVKQQLELFRLCLGNQHRKNDVSGSRKGQYRCRSDLRQADPRAFPGNCQIDTTLLIFRKY